MSEPTKCRILLDVDGVLNAVCTEPNTQHWDDWDSAVCNGFTITYSATVGERLLRLAELPGVELLWLTTWEHEANTWIGPLFGWPPFDVIERHDLSQTGWGRSVSSGPWWKFVEAKKLWDADPVPFVWIDDDLRFDADGATEWIGSLDGKALGVCPYVREGLTPDLVDHIESFVTERLLD
jgi:hypothetical protein